MIPNRLARLGGGLLVCALLACAAGTARATCPLAPPAGTTCINGGGAKSSSAELGQEFTAFTNVNPALGVGFDFTATPSIAGQNAFAFDDPAQYNTGFTTDAFPVHFAVSDSYVDSASPLFNYDSSALGIADGPYIQIPFIGIPVAIPVANPKITGNTLTLSDNDLCGIFSGKLTVWGQTSVHASVAKGTITVVYREDSTGAGTTFLLTQHLAAVCNTSNTMPGVTFKATNFFAQLFGVTTQNSSGYWVMPASYTNFLGANGLTGEAAAMLAATSAVAYISPDYTSIAPTPSNPSYKAIHVAKVVNAQDHGAYLPTVTNTVKALQNPGSAQNVTAPTSAQAAANPLLWVPIIPTPAHGYPIVGLTTWILSQCYKTPVVATGIVDFLLAHYGAKYDAISSSFGYVPASKLLGGYLPQIENVFLTAHSGFHLNINDPKACAGLGR
jgi:ABC-type phosphate transport system substrate-binding protein